MLFWTVQTIIISIIFIFLIHHLITYFKQILTVPRTKDLVNSPIQKYNDMFKIISNSDSSSSSSSSSSPINVNDYLPKNIEDTLLPQQVPVVTNETKTSMKNELKSFLKKQLNSGNTNQNLGNNTTDISTLDIMDKSSASPFYAAY
jgi:hypothetical protein